MDKRESTHNLGSRAPLGDNSKRGNSVPPKPRRQPSETYENESKENIPVVVVQKEPGSQMSKKTAAPAVSQPPVNPRLSIISQASYNRHASKRSSHVSTASASTAHSNDTSKLKTHIGPWQLGKTLGKGSSARVRLARHKVTYQSVAVKIISKRTAYLSQAGSIAQLDKVERDLPEEEDGFRRLPVTVEREIAIMKLIEHPNIIKILDVWENRNEIPEAKDLIRRILVTDPDKRISIREMWDHPLISKYGKLRGFKEHRKQPVDMRTRSKDAPINPRDIDPQIVRQLRAMWHSTDEQDIKSKLFSKGPNDQKLFYHLLVSHRDRLLEDYDPDLTHSASDYHHLRPPAWTTRVSTRQFKTLGRTPSRFTVISTVADTEAGGTVRSYDPYYASRNLAPGQASHAKITVHRGGLEPGTARSVASGSVPSRMGTGSSSQARRKLNSSLRSRTVSYAQSQRSSMSSIRSSLQGTTGLLVKPRHKRGVEFSSIRKGAAPVAQQIRGRSIHASASIAGDQTTYNRDNTSPQSPKKRTKREDVHTTGSVNNIRAATPIIGEEEMIQFSNSIAKDCDDAFRSSIVCSPSGSLDRNRRSLTPFSIEFGTPSFQRTPEPAYKPRVSGNPWDSRPLPPTPPIELTPSPQRHVDVKVEPQTPQEATDSRYDPNITLNVAPLATPSANPRRITSAPAYALYARDPRALPAIFESPDAVNGQPRTVSAPPLKVPAPLPTPNGNQNLDFLAANGENTIRIVESPTARKSTGSAIIPEPLNVRKKSACASSQTMESRKVSQEIDVRKKHTFHSQMPDLPEEPATNNRSRSSSNGSSIGPKKKLSTWFRRTSKTSSKCDVTETPDEPVVNEDRPRDAVSSAVPQRFNSTSTSAGAAPPDMAAPPAKKNSFIFWRTSKSDHRMSIAAPDYEDDPSSLDAKHRLPGAASLTQDGYGNGDNGDTVARKIEPRQNWLARLFRVKPAMRYLCLQISRRRARQEVTILLREWRKWGMRDVEVDKERNIVFARVGKKNFLNIKEVNFAVEIITVIEHGKRNHLSIVRFTQEKGAASSFHKVVETMSSVFTSRGLLVQDKRKAKMMIKTLNS
ncbi:hypothetical protein VSDG_06050 [Cytospora chrysosperma]|uniref:non-specific serine/threonine protein kinase n=1 Tax=Cytospora chrysosperma TaxID=252740 RepID=A0A423VWH8_CYTCH|nr:hypothetical protein VSDG_06050 [Valsa sordida]